MKVSTVVFLWVYFGREGWVWQLAVFVFVEDNIHRHTSFFQAAKCETTIASTYYKSQWSLWLIQANLENQCFWDSRQLTRCGIPGVFVARQPCFRTTDAILIDQAHHRWQYNTKASSTPGLCPREYPEWESEPEWDEQIFLTFQTRCLVTGRRTFLVDMPDTMRHRAFDTHGSWTIDRCDMMNDSWSEAQLNDCLLTTWFHRDVLSNAWSKLFDWLNECFQENQ